MSEPGLRGGCQCGAVRFSIGGGLGRASICHCRMCQKAFGNAFAPLVTAHGLSWTRGEPTYYQSSNKVRRGFCRSCGTPLVYQPLGGSPEIAICALDEPNRVPPTIQVGLEGRLAWCDKLPGLPSRPLAETEDLADFFNDLISYQHPDHDTPA